MHVLATAGHVDHGKSALLRALTGMEPDRWEEENRRGMTLDLGFVWTALDSGERVAFVDVPGHQRFVPTMLAGVGPVPAVLFVVAADEGWKQQSAEHLDALDALGIRHGLIVVTRCDLADPASAMAQARDQVSRTSLRDAETVAVSAITGHGMNQVRDAIDRLILQLPAPQPDAPVRFWIDRAFTMRGAGTVVTGTLGAGRVSRGDQLVVHPGGHRVCVRSIQMLGQTTDTATPVARVALNLRGVSVEQVRRGHALLTPDAWLPTSVIDVRIRGETSYDHATCTMHIGSAAIPARVRRLGRDTVRLTLDTDVPLRVGDIALLRDPGRHQIIGGAIVLDPQPPAFHRRGDARRRTDLLATMTGIPHAADELRRRRLIRTHELRTLGVNGPVTEVTGGWVADPEHWEQLKAGLVDAVTQHATDFPLEAGLSADVARQRLDLPDTQIVKALVGDPLEIRNGRVSLVGFAVSLPPHLQFAVNAIRADLKTNLWAAPTAQRLEELGLGPRELDAAVRAGALERIGTEIYLLPGSIDAAATTLRALRQPFTVSQARSTLRTTRRVAVPLLELLDSDGITCRVSESGRRFMETEGLSPGPR
jgi:selenocysteine-specific elongation factor